MVLASGLGEGFMLLPAFIFLPFFGFGFVMYFLPSIIALARSKRDITGDCAA